MFWLPSDSYLSKYTFNCSYTYLLQRTNETDCNCFQYITLIRREQFKTTCSFKSNNSPGVPSTSSNDIVHGAMFDIVK